MELDNLKEGLRQKEKELLEYLDSYAGKEWKDEAREKLGVIQNLLWALSD